MSEDQKPADSGSSQARLIRTWGIGLGAVSLLVGLYFLLGPFVSSSQPWEWTIRGAGDLEHAMINGMAPTPELLARLPIESDGIVLRRIDEHHASLITPPLDLPRSAGRVATVRAALPGVSDSRLVETQVYFLWQTEPSEGFRSQMRIAMLSETPTDVAFSLPEAASRLHRFGFQFRGDAGAVRVASLRIPEFSTAQRLQLAGSQLITSEPIDNARINFFKGPQILGHGLNYYFVSLIALATGAYALVAGLRRKQQRGWHGQPARESGNAPPRTHNAGIRPQPATTVARGARWVLGVALACWMFADALFTWNLVRQARAVVPAFRGTTRIEQIALADGGDIAWAYEALLAHSAPADDFAVLSDDPFTPAHRLAYLLAPIRTRRESCLEADFMVVIHAGAAHYDAENRQLSLGDGASIRADLIAAKSAHVYLLRRIEP